MSFPFNPSDGQKAVVNGIKYTYTAATNSWRRDFNNVLDRLFLVGGNEAVNTATGDLIVYGGAVVRKNLIVGKNLTVQGTATFVNSIIGTVSTATSTINLSGGSEGSLVYQTTTSTTGFINIAATGTILMSNGVIPIWTSTAAITAAYSVTATNVVGGGQWQIPFQSSSGVTAFSSNLTYDTTKLSIANTTTSSSPTTGALTVLGGVGISGNLYIGGNFQVNGTTTYINASNLDITDKNITLAKGSANAAASDQAGITVEGPTVQPTILYRSSNDSWTVNKLFSAPSVIITDTTASISTSTGALQIVGGLGVGGQVYATGINGQFTGAIGSSTKNTGAFTTVDVTDGTQSISTTSGALKVVGGVGIGKDMYVGGRINTNDIRITSASNAISTTTGALVVTGGVGIGGDLRIAGTIYGSVTSAINAISATTATNSTFASNLVGGVTGRIPYQTAGSVTGFSPFLNYTGLAFETNRINITTSTSAILPSVNYGLDLINTGINQSPVLRLSGSTSGILLLSSFGALRVMQDATTITNTLLNVGLTGVSIPTVTSSISTQTGSLIVSGGVGIAQDIWVGGNVNSNGIITTGIQSAYDVHPVVAITSATGIVVHNLNLAETFYHSSIVSNFTANITNVPTTDGREYFVKLVLNQGATGQYASAIQINGVGQTLRWSSAPTANANRVEIQTLRIIRINSAWFVLGTLTSYV